MRLTRTLAVGSIALGLTVAGAAGASALQTPDGWSPARWMHQTMTTVTDAPGAGNGQGAVECDGTCDGTQTPRPGATGDPTTCPYAEDGTADRDQMRQRLHDGDGSGTADHERARARMHATT